MSAVVPPMGYTRVFLTLLINSAQTALLLRTGVYPSLCTRASMVGIYASLCTRASMVGIYASLLWYRATLVGIYASLPWCILYHPGYTMYIPLQRLHGRRVTGLVSV